MANVHTLKNATHEAVFKVYSTESAGGVYDISLADDVCADTETFDANNAIVTIQEIFWGAKKDKQIDLSRVDDPEANTVHGHYYLLNSGHYDFVGFVDDVYADGDIRITADGPFHMIIKVKKVSGFTPA